MGNMVVIAIRHSDLEATRNIDFDVFESMIHFVEFNCPKFYDGRNNTENLGRHSRSGVYNGTALMSNYHHADDNVTLVVSNEIMFQFPSYFDFDLKGIDTEKMVQKLVNSGKDIDSFYRKEKINIRKSASKKATPISDGDSYSLFGFLTDEMNRINKETVMHAMVDSIENGKWVENGEIVRNNYDSKLRSSPIYFLGNFRSDQIAIVNLMCNSFSTISTPNYGIDTASITQKIEDNKSLDESHHRISCFEDIIKGFNRYIVKPKS